MIPHRLASLAVATAAAVIVAAWAEVRADVTGATEAPPEAPAAAVDPAEPPGLTGAPARDASRTAEPPPPVAEALVAAARRLAAREPDLALAALAAIPEMSDSAPPAAPWVGRAELLRGSALVRAGRPAEALAPLDRAAQRLPVLADLARFRRAEAVRAAGDPAGAAVALDQFLRDFPDSPWAAEAAATLGGARADAGDLLGAVAADRSYLASRLADWPAPLRGPGSPGSLADGVRLRLGASLEALGRTDEAAAVYRTLVVERPLARVADEAAMRLARLAPPKSPLRLLSPEERLTRAQILFDAYRNAEALRDFDALDLTRLPGGEGGALAQDVRLKRGLALFRLRRYPDAARELGPLAQQATALAEEARFWRARALARQGRSREAIAEFSAIADGTPGGRFAGQAAYLAAVVLGDLGETAEAAARLRALADRLGRTGLAADALWQLAWGRYRDGDLAGADEVLDELLRRFANSDVADRAAYWRARVELRLGRVDQAIPRLTDLTLRRPLSWYGVQAARRLEEHDRELAVAPEAAGAALAPEPDCCRPGAEPAAPALERATLLVQLGLLPEARAELGALQRRVVDLPVLETARLLYAAGDFHRPLGIARILAPAPLERLGLDPERRLLPLAFPRGYRAAVEAQARTARVPIHLAYALIRAESVFDPAAVSPVGARGLMQLMPATAETLAPALGATPFDPDLLFDPEANVRFGVTLLGRLLAKYPGRPDLAVAAYNAGPEAVARWIEAFGHLAEDEFVESIPFTETRGYVMKVTANWRTYDALYGQP